MSVVLISDDVGDRSAAAVMNELMRPKNFECFDGETCGVSEDTTITCANYYNNLLLDVH